MTVAPNFNLSRRKHVGVNHLVYDSTRAGICLPSRTTLGASMEYQICKNKRRYDTMSYVTYSTESLIFVQCFVPELQTESEKSPKTRNTCRVEPSRVGLKLHSRTIGLRGGISNTNWDAAKVPASRNKITTLA